MNRLLIAAFVATILSIGTASAYSLVDTHKECFADTDSEQATCITSILRDYESLHFAHSSAEESRGLWEESYYHLRQESANKTSALEAEVQLWKVKYTNLLSQQGGSSTMQDQLTNLTARVDAVETQTERNESHIYIIQNMLRTVQTDIESIWLKINSVR